MTRPETETIRTNVPSRLHRLPWARSHRMVLAGFGLPVGRAVRCIAVSQTQPPALSARSARQT